MRVFPGFNDSNTRGEKSFWLIPLAAFVLVIIGVGISRESPFDEDFTYAWTVRHLLDTGEYKLHDWAAPDIRFQAYWGALFVDGSSHLFSRLRVSTLVLSAAGLIAFYAMGRRRGLSGKHAALAVLALIGSPFFLNYAFCFCTDGPYLALVLLSLCFYTAGWEDCSWFLMVGGSVCASAAILTRQIGLALPASVVVAWILSGNRRGRMALGVAGIALPAAAGWWVAKDTVSSINLSSQFVRINQGDYLHHPVRLLTQIPWRLSITLETLTIAVLPLALFAGVAAMRLLTLRRRPRRKVYVVGAIICGLLWLSEMAYQPVFLENHPNFWNQNSFWLPHVPWYFGWLYGGYPAAPAVAKAMTLLTLPLMIGAGILVAAALYRGLGRLRQLRPDLLYIFSGFTLIQLMIYFKMGDKYVIPLLPIFILIICRGIRPFLRRWWVLLAIFCATCAGVQTLYLHNSLTRGAAVWAESDRLRETGVSPLKIDTDWEWVGYYCYGDFATEAKANGWTADVENHFWWDWYPQQKREATYRIEYAADGLIAPAGWKIIHDAAAGRTYGLADILFWRDHPTGYKVYTLWRDRSAVCIAGRSASPYNRDRWPVTPKAFKP